MVTNSLWGLRAAIAAALGVAMLVTAVRLARRQSIRPAVGGFVGVAISSRTSEARDFFLADIWWSLTACIALTASILLRRPLVGVVWNALLGDQGAASRPRRGGGFPAPTC